MGYEMAITKQAFLAKLANLYRECNMADSDNPDRSDWMKPGMAGEAGCAAFDMALRNMVKCGAITAEEHQDFLDGL